MKKAILLTALVLGLCSLLFASKVQASPITTETLEKIPLAFTKNMGQWDERVLYRANAGGATMWFTKEGVTYQFTRRIDRSSAASVPGLANAVRPYDPADRFSQEKDSVEQLVLTAKFVDANPNPEIVGEGLMEYKCNYFIGNDPAKWHTDVPNYEAITLNDIYPGIDLKYSGEGNGQAAYEFIAAPGADISQVKVAYEGAEETSLDVDGRMVLKTKWGDMLAAINPTADATGLASPRFVANAEKAPSIAGESQSLSGTKSGTLTLNYSTYLGGESDDYGDGIAVDCEGNAYVTGHTYSYNFPIKSAYDSIYNGSHDVFVTKFSSSGTLIYSTYLGGESTDDGFGIAVDIAGNAYVTGRTRSRYFPTQNPYQTYRGASGLYDVFVTKLSSSGNNLIYSTFFGGGSSDGGASIAVDGSGNAYVVGTTSSSDFPILNPYQATFQGGGDVFVTKLSNSGNSLIYSTYLGGGAWDEGEGITVDGCGCAYLTGMTGSFNFPTQNPYQTIQGGQDAFVTKLSSSGNNLIYSTYLGGGDNEGGNSIEIDGNGNAYVTGHTWSSDFPTLNPYQTDQGYDDAFVTKLSSSGNSLIYSTYLGGGSNDGGASIAVDGSGNAYVVGRTSSSDFPTLNPYQATFQGGGDVFVTKLSNSGASLIYSTYLGGGSDDEGWGIAIDGSGNAYVTGDIHSSNFPTQNAYQTGIQGYVDAFVTKLSWTSEYDCGDVNTDEQVDLLDAVFMINYIFVGGPAPQSLSLAEVDCSGSINIADVVLLINYIFRAGPAPCVGCK